MTQKKSSIKASTARPAQDGLSSGDQGSPDTGGNTGLDRQTNQIGLTYADAGVSIEAGNTLVERIKPLVASTRRQGVLGGIGGFGGLFELPVDRYRQPVMVSGADGVGTKLRLAIELGIHDTIGIDLVAMCVNDIIVCGAEPLWFLDYYATGKLDVEQAEDVIRGIVEGCIQSGAALLGGESAEMPGMYGHGDYDLAGFAVGVVEKAAIIDGSKVAIGNSIIALASSGPHSNGYSLIRQLLDKQSIKQAFGQCTLGEALLAPTRIYAKSVATVLASHPVHALAHITGGGLTENIPRVLPAATEAVINRNCWDFPEIFNCGIGMVLVVDSADESAVLATLATAGEQASVIGSIQAGSCHPSVRYV